MNEQANRIDWLERQLAQVRELAAQDKDRLEGAEPDFATRLALSSWQSRAEEIQQQLRQEKAALQHEVLQLRLVGRRMDGSIPLRLLTSVSDKVSAILAHTAYHLRHGVGPRKGGLDGLYDEMDLRLSGLAFGSTRLVFAGNITPDTTGDSAMGGALEQIFSILQTQDSELIRELATAIGGRATKALSELLALLDRQDIGAELVWPAPNATIHHWGGSLAEVRYAHQKLSALEVMKPTEIALQGAIAQLKDNGALYVRTEEGQVLKVSYNNQQYQHVQQFTLGMHVHLKVMLYQRIDPLTGRETNTYKLVTEK